MAVQTYGIPPEEERTDPVTGQPVASPNTATPETSTSAPPLSGGKQTVNTPVAEATNTQGGGAESSQMPFDPSVVSDLTPSNLIRNTIRKDPDQAFDTLSASAAAAKKAAPKDRLGQLDQEKLNLQLGIDNGEEAREQVLGEDGEVARTIAGEVAAGIITPKQAKQKRFALKNIYNTIKPEEMGLFLIDFGLRAMMAGETMGDLGALGAAGSGAMGALQERRRYASEQKVAAEERTRKAGLESREVEAKERAAEGRALAESYTDPDTGNLMVPEWDADQKKYVYKDTGKKGPLTKKDRPYAQQEAVAALVAAGYDKDQASVIVYGGGVSEEEAQRIAAETWNKMLDKGRPDTVGSSEWRQMSPDQKRQYEREWKANFISQIAVTRQISDEEAARRALQKHNQ